MNMPDYIIEALALRVAEPSAAEASMLHEERSLYFTRKDFN